jgi:hypothetical protein
MIKLTSKVMGPLSNIRSLQLTTRNFNTQSGRSNLFNNPQLRALREKIRGEENPLNRYEADVTRLRTVKEDNDTQSSAYRAEIVYSSDLDSVLSLLKN